jgi:hypothetical protein
MNGEVRIWDSRAPDKPLYEDIPQPQGLMALAVHPGAPVFASYVYFRLAARIEVTALHRWSLEWSLHV